MLEFDLPQPKPADIFADVFHSGGAESVGRLHPVLIAAGDPFSPDIRERYLAEIDRRFKKEIPLILPFWFAKNPDLTEYQAISLAVTLLAASDPVCGVLFWRALCVANRSCAEDVRRGLLERLADDADGFARLALDDTLRGPVPVTGRIPPGAYARMVLAASLHPDGLELNEAAAGIAAVLERKWTPNSSQEIEAFVAAVAREALPVRKLGHLRGFGRLAHAVRNRQKAGEPVPSEAMEALGQCVARAADEERRITAACVRLFFRAETAELIRKGFSMRDFHAVNAAAEELEPDPEAFWPDLDSGRHRLAPDFEKALAAGTAEAVLSDDEPILTERTANFLVTLGLRPESAAFLRLTPLELAGAVTKEEGRGKDMSLFVSMLGENAWRRLASKSENLADDTPWEDLPARFAFAFRRSVARSDALRTHFTADAVRTERTLREVKGLSAAGNYFFSHALQSASRKSALFLIGSESWREAGGEVLHIPEKLFGSGVRRKNTLWEDLQDAFRLTAAPDVLGRLASVLIPMYPEMKGSWERRSNGAMLKKALMAGALTEETLGTGMSVGVFKEFLRNWCRPDEVDEVRNFPALGPVYRKVAWDLKAGYITEPEAVAEDIFRRKRAGIGPCRKYGVRVGALDALPGAVRILQSETPLRRAVKLSAEAGIGEAKKSIELAASSVLSLRPKLAGALRLLVFLDFKGAAVLDELAKDGPLPVSADRKVKELQALFREKGDLRRSGLSADAVTLAEEICRIGSAKNAAHEKTANRED